MPKAMGGPKFHYLDYDSDYISEVPPVQNTWYEVFHAYDVRLIWCALLQSNTETAAKDVEVRWTIDGNVYFRAFSAPDSTLEFISRIYVNSAAGTQGLTYGTTERNAAWSVDKRGHDFKVEVRLTGVAGTNQILRAWCVRETLEIT